MNKSLEPQNKWRKSLEPKTSAQLEQNPQPTHQSVNGQQKTPHLNYKGRKVERKVSLTPCVLCLKRNSSQYLISQYITREEND